MQERVSDWHMGLFLSWLLCDPKLFPDPRDTTAGPDLSRVCPSTDYLCPTKTITSTTTCSSPGGNPLPPQTFMRSASRDPSRHSTPLNHAFQSLWLCAPCRPQASSLIIFGDLDPVHADSLTHTHTHPDCLGTTVGGLRPQYRSLFLPLGNILSSKLPGESLIDPVYSRARCATCNPDA